MQDELLRAGDQVTIRKGAPLLPDGRRKLTRDCLAVVISVHGRSVKVEPHTLFVEEADGSKIVAPFAMFDLSYIYRRDS